MKRIKTVFFMAIVTAVLCAGTVSARQLRGGAYTSTTTCGGSCSLTHACASGCVCSFTTPTTAFCTTRLAGVVSPKK